MFREMNSGSPTLPEKRDRRILITDSDITARYHGISNYIKVKNSLNTFYNSCILSMYFL